MGERTGAGERVKLGLSEIRILILGAEILLGFQYEAIFQHGFSHLAFPLRAIEAAGLLILVLVVVLMIAPGPFHRISERGAATERQNRFTDAMMVLSLAPFALAIGLDIVVALSSVLGLAGAALFGASLFLLSLVVWFGIALMSRTPPPPPGPDEAVPLSERISELMTEARIVLPGVQALLGFQLVAYLTEFFPHLDRASKAFHTAGLAFLVICMILLIAPASFHRIAEHGECNERVERVGVAFLLASLVPLALALAADVFVALDVVFSNIAWAAVGCLAALLVALGGWFALPYVWRRPTRDSRR